PGELGDVIGVVLAIGLVIWQKKLNTVKVNQSQQNIGYRKVEIMRKSIIISFIILMMLVMAACSDNETSSESSDKPSAPDKFLTIRSGPMGSGSYPITTTMTE